VVPFSNKRTTHPIFFSNIPVIKNNALLFQIILATPHSSAKGRMTPLPTESSCLLQKSVKSAEKWSVAGIL
jgi:hypothetical protein